MGRHGSRRCTPNRNERRAAHAPKPPARFRRSRGGTREGVRVLHEALAGVPPTVLARWRAIFGKWAGRGAGKSAAPSGQTGRPIWHLLRRAGSDTLLFALQTYYALLVSVVAGRLLGSNGEDLLPDNPFSWCSAAPSAGRPPVGGPACRCRGLPAGRRIDRGCRRRLRSVQAALRGPFSASAAAAAWRILYARLVGRSRARSGRLRRRARQRGCWIRPAAPARSW